MLVRECSSEDEKSVGIGAQRKRMPHGYLCSGHKDSYLKDSDPSTLSERSASREKRLKNEKQLGRNGVFPADQKELKRNEPSVPKTIFSLLQTSYRSTLSSPSYTHPHIHAGTQGSTILPLFSLLLPVSSKPVQRSL
ncbi:hypothetical protein mRhiFer1_009584 [Rhinolophus ferrumequinum]|uniref:Uncharacterized protein n=1 Tax=Rhinolophus ferrumequinum TaxID=59479 RepID=A0A7J7ZQJ2_RHIFE|nr:hypothetical protein mRhiFer1_009584 [Rhinolophus ferrumequinum]